MVQALYDQAQSAEINYAINLAMVAHDRQVDKLGVPYTAHVLSVAITLMRERWPSEVVVAGALHDTIEDCGYTPAYLKGMGIHPVAVELVEAVTRGPDETYDHFVNRVMAAGEQAQAIKRADLCDNLSRLHNLPSPTRDRLTKKYTRLAQLLNVTIPNRM